MNEPASFLPPTKTLPEQCRHHTEHGLIRHALAHNVYGMQMARASFDGSLLQQPDHRPFIITRAAYAGTQRHAMVWTGDNASSWEHLADSVQMLLNLGLSGFPFCGGDAGGFLDNCTPELYARWLQLAAFTPFFRNHTMLGTMPHEPWCFGPEVESVVRSYIELRYQLLPYWYGLFAEAHRTGSPIMRPMVWEQQHDPVAATCGDQFLIGSSLLVAPILHQGAVARSVYLPGGTWFEYWTGRRHPGGRHVVAEAPLSRMPIYVRGGSIVPMIPVRQHTGGRSNALVYLHLWRGGSGRLDWYEDDGESLGYTRGASHRRPIQWNGQSLVFGSSEGNYASRVRKWRVVTHNVNQSIKARGVHSGVRYHPPTRTALFDLQNTPVSFCVKMR
jgi:alpha-glucosidase